MKKQAQRGEVTFLRSISGLLWIWHLKEEGQCPTRHQQWCLSPGRQKTLKWWSALSSCCSKEPGPCRNWILPHAFSQRVGTYYFDKIVGSFPITFEIYISLRTNRSVMIGGFMLYQASYSILLKTVATGEEGLQSSPKRLLPLHTLYANFPNLI